MKHFANLFVLNIVNHKKTITLNFVFLALFGLYFFMTTDSIEMFLLALFAMSSFIFPYNLIAKIIFYEDKYHTLTLLVATPLKRRTLAASRFAFPLIVNGALLAAHIIAGLFYRNDFSFGMTGYTIALSFLFLGTLFFSFVILLLAEYFEVTTVMQIVRFMPFTLVILSFAAKYLIEPAAIESITTISIYLLYTIFILPNITIFLWGWKKFLNRKTWK